MVNGIPLFTFTVRFYSINCLVDKDDPSVVVDGNEFSKTLNDYILHVTYDEMADLEEKGHNWTFIRIFEMNKVKVLL